MVSWSSGSWAGCGELRLFAVAVADISVPAGFVGGDPRAALCPVAVDAYVVAFPLKRAVQTRAVQAGG